MRFPGVSVIICCYNSATRIEPTLQHLQNQEFSQSINWEVILVNNASTDCTVEQAKSIWANNPVCPLRIVDEPTPGLSYARVKGFREATYQSLSLIDDDNWVDRNWVARVDSILSHNPSIGACGGINLGVTDTAWPDWFESVQGCYAIGRQGGSSGPVSGILWGAGLSISAEAWERLESSGFRFTMPDRTGNRLIAGGDCELCFGLKLLGYQLWFDESLRLQHYMPANRLTDHYYQRLMLSMGATDAWAEIYREIFDSVSIHWSRSCIAESFRSIWGATKLVMGRFIPRDRYQDRAWFWARLGKLQELVQSKSKLAQQRVAVRDWVRSLPNRTR